MEIGERYEAASTILIRNNQWIDVGSTWAVNCTSGNMVSMSLTEGGVSGGADQLTIYKSVFGANFKSSHLGRLSPDAYRTNNHWYNHNLSSACLLYPR